jgi:H+/Cl- antiporter ClcA
MPRYPSRMEIKTDRFDKLPKKVQLCLLMLVVLAAAAIEFLMGLHSVHTGKPIVLGNQSISDVESFFWSAACLAIFAGLFAVFMGWAKSSKADPPE